MLMELMSPHTAEDGSEIPPILSKEDGQRLVPVGSWLPTCLRCESPRIEPFAVLCSDCKDEWAVTPEGSRIIQSGDWREDSMRQWAEDRRKEQAR